MEDHMIEEYILTYKIFLEKYTTYRYQLDYVIDGDGTKYEHVNWLSENFEKPSKENLDEKIKSFAQIERNNCLNVIRKREYPSTEEWVIAYIQKELDGQPEEWDQLVKKRTDIRNKFFK